MFTVDTFFKFEIETASFRTAFDTMEFATYDEVKAHVSRTRDWGNVRNVGQGAMIDRIVVRVVKADAERWHYTEFAAKGSGWFDGGREYFSN